jgi:hypothetical protein
MGISPDSGEGDFAAKRGRLYHCDEHDHMIPCSRSGTPSRILEKAVFLLPDGGLDIIWSVINDCVPAAVCSPLALAQL